MRGARADSTAAQADVEFAALKSKKLSSTTPSAFSVAQSASKNREELDLDGDGVVSHKDAAFARRFGLLDDDANVRIDPAARELALEHLRTNYPDGFTEVVDDFAEFERLVWEGAAADLQSRLEEVTEEMDSEDVSKLATVLLMAACQAGHSNLIDLMTDTYGADVYMINARGEMAMLMAADFGEWDAAYYLQEKYSLSLNEADNSDKSLWDHALRNNLGALTWLLMNGTNVTKGGFVSALDKALDSNSYDLAGFLYGYHHSTITVRQFVNRLFRLGKDFSATSSRFSEVSFFAHVKAGLEGNKDPLSGSLKMSALFEALGERDKSSKHIYLEQKEYFDERALWLWDNIESDVMASFVLEQRRPDSVDGTPLEIALEAQNLGFVTNPRLSRIVDGWWRPFEFDADSIFASPGELFRSPAVKFYLDGAAFVMFLFLFSWLLTKSKRIEDDTILLEWVLLVFGIGFFINELQQMRSSGFMAYWNQGWNKIDMTICVGIFIVVTCRSVSWEDDGVRSVADGVYIGAMSINAVIMWVRALFLFSDVPALGPLLLTLEKMIYDIINFSLLQIIFIIGFYFALSFTIFGGQTGESTEFLDDWGTTRKIFLNLFQGGLSGDPITNVEGITETRRVFVELLASIHLLISAVVLINLLIAMMGATFQAVKDNSDAEFVFQRIANRWGYDQSVNDLPPPLNVLVLAIFAVLWPFNYIINCFYGATGQEYDPRRRRQIGAARKSQYCFYCHRTWRNGELRDGERIAWTAQDRFPTLLDFKFETEEYDSPEHSVVDALYRQGEICKCVRLRKLISGDRYMIERLSTYVFAAVLWLPVVVAYALLLAIVSTISWVITKTAPKIRRFSVINDEALHADANPVLDVFRGVKVPELAAETVDRKLDELLNHIKSSDSSSSAKPALGFRGARSHTVEQRERRTTFFSRNMTGAF